MNPAFTLSFFRLGKVAPWDVAFYTLAQFVGGIGGILAVALVAAVSFANTKPRGDNRPPTTDR